MKFWKYGRVALALMGSIVLGLSITCCGVYTSGYMYVSGAQFSQIAAYKIDHDFGYLTPVTGSPFPSAGGNPVQMVLVPGGRFLAVLSKTAGTVTMYTIGGAGVLYFQASYSTSGSNPVSIGLAPGGNYLYAIDSLAPDGSGRGDVTVFAIDSSTGKLTLVTNQNTFNTNGSQLPYFEVNYKPVQVVSAGGSGGSYLYVLDQAYLPGSTGIPAACQNQPTGSPCATPDIFLYAINSTNGQLTLTQNQPLQIGTSPGAASTIAVSASGKYLYVADTANGDGTGRILPFTIGSGGVLQTLVGGPVNNLTGASTNPDAIITNSNTNFLYVANFGPNNIQEPNSNISEYSIDPTNGQLQQIAGGNANGLNPAPTGSGPIWMAEDPTNQYLYTADYAGNTVTAKVIDSTHGLLSNLLKGATQFTTVGQPTFVVVTGRTY